MRHAARLHLTNARQATYVRHMPNITTAEAAQMLGVSVRTVHRMVSAGTLTPTIKGPGVTGAYFIDAEQVQNVKRNKAA